MSDIEFYITLPSNDTSYPEPNQNPNNFRVLFPSPINFDHTYQVALYELFYTCEQYDETITVDGSQVTTAGDIPNDLFVYCDLIEAQIVGSNQVRQLKHINNTSNGVSQVFRASYPLQWVDVISRHINKIHFQINDQRGKYVPMSGTTVAVLAFRQKP